MFFSALLAGSLVRLLAAVGLVSSALFALVLSLAA
jgi:hypothetical protein